MRNNLFWIVAILAAVPAVCFFVVGIRVVDKAPWFMAGFTYLVAVFTFLLWQATKKYAETTEGLLKQSEEAVRQSRLLAEVTREYTEVTRKLLNQSKEALAQSRISFLVSIVERTIEYVESLKKYDQYEKAEYIVKKTEAINRISREKEISLEFLDAMIDYSKSGTILKTELEKYKKVTFGQS